MKLDNRERFGSVVDSLLTWSSVLTNSNSDVFVYLNRRRRVDTMIISVASRTLWLGRIPSNCSDDDIKSALSVVGIPEKINIILPRACAYVTMTDRRSAFKVIDKMQNSLVVARKNVKVGHIIEPSQS
jgi:RNA recognition motif-containing protein